MTTGLRTIKHGVSRRTRGAESNLPTDLEWGGQNVCVREREKKPIREKGVKYIIYLHWQRETNALTEIEDTSPSLIDTQTHTRAHFGLKIG